MNPAAASAAPTASVDLLRVPIAHPGDLAPVEALRDAGYALDDVLAVVGKTEGNGCVNDFSRTLATARWEPVLPPETVTVFSGGTEGVLSPHVNLVVADPGPATWRRASWAGNRNSPPSASWSRSSSNGSGSPPTRSISCSSSARC
jgi:hypothetical protein